MKPTILITGATGKTGSAAVHQLLQKGWPVRAAVHSIDARSERLRQAGAEVVAADIYDPQQILEVMRGTARAYFCPPVRPFMIQAASAFAIAARVAKLESIVHLGMWIAAPAHPALHTRQQWLNEKLFNMIPGVGYTTVNPGVFADPILGMVPACANLGALPNPFGNFKNAPPSNEDMAKVVVAALIDPDRHAGKRYRPTGPQTLSMQEIAEIIGRVVGRPVKLQDLPMKTFLKAVRANGASDFELAIFPFFAEDGYRGVFETHCSTDDVYEVSGERPETFETTVRRYAAKPRAQRTFANKMRALRDFGKILITPAFNASRYAKTSQQPVLARPQLAAESTIWELEHQTNDLSQDAWAVSTS